MTRIFNFEREISSVRLQSCFFPDADSYESSSPKWASLGTLIRRQCKDNRSFEQIRLDVAVVRQSRSRQKQTALWSLSQDIRPCHHWQQTLLPNQIQVHIESSHRDIKTNQSMICHLEVDVIYRDHMEWWRPILKTTSNATKEEDAFIKPACLFVITRIVPQRETYDERQITRTNLIAELACRRLHECEHMTNGSTIKRRTSVQEAYCRRV